MPSPPIDDADKTEDLNILLVDESPERAKLLRETLSIAGYRRVTLLTDARSLVQSVADNRPNVVLIDVESPSRDTLEQLSLLRDQHPTPVLMIAQDPKAQSSQAAVRSGVCAYSVDGISAEKVRPAIEVAMATFATYDVLRGQLAKAREDLSQHKRVDRAKYLLMDKHRLNEQQAHDALRKFAMDRKRKLAEAADDIIALLRELKTTS